MIEKPLKLLFVFIAIVWVTTACDQTKRSKQETPHLMNGASIGTSFQGSDRYSRPKNPIRTLKEMQMSHEEKMAAIEAEKAKALKQLELEKTRSVEELRKRTREIEAQSALKLAEEKRKYAALVAAKEQRIKELEAATAREQSSTQKAVVQMQTQSRQTIERLKSRYGEKIAMLNAELTQRRLWIGVGVLILLLLFWFFFYRYRKQLEAKQREEERRHEARLLESRQQHERIDKILEIIASGDADTEVKVELTKLLQQGLSESDTKLIEYKKGN
ncbi:hypothetical protein [Nitratifractor sp.]|uniref:hypothetical protein n=1 Tax=Nitratifractor sp. TaxID=2268144 RepID=UPI0025D4EAF7|nr:hypothetical protein [Nitratifractor sp.]